MTEHIDRSYFFIAGPPKGGTTWLMRLLDAHPEAACSGVEHYFDRLRPMMMEVFEKYQRLLSLDAKLVFSDNPVLSLVRHRHVSDVRHRGYPAYRSAVDDCSDHKLGSAG